MGRLSLWQLTKVALLAWLAEIGFDFLLHAGVLADWYELPIAFLLPLDAAFPMIPLGYLSFLLFTVLLVWLIAKMNVVGWRGGMEFGLKLGGLMWLAFTLALASIATAPPGLLFGWFIGQTVELGIAGLIVGAGIEAKRLGPLLVRVLGFFVLCIIAGVVLRNL